MGDTRDTKPKRIKTLYAEKPAGDPPPRPRRDGSTARQIWHQCLGCHSWYAVQFKEINRGRQTCCSPKCAGDLAAATGKFKGAKNPRWLGGVSTDNMRYQRRALERHPVEIAARKAVRAAVLRGDLIPQRCRCGGDAKTQGHHPDYSKPLDVIWLCRPCHDAEHARLKIEKRAETPAVARSR